MVQTSFLEWDTLVAHNADVFRRLYGTISVMPAFDTDTMRMFAVEKRKATPKIRFGAKKYKATYVEYVQM